MLSFKTPQLVASAFLDNEPFLVLKQSTLISDFNPKWPHLSRKEVKGKFNLMTCSINNLKKKNWLGLWYFTSYEVRQHSENQAELEIRDTWDVVPCLPLVSLHAGYVASMGLFPHPCMGLAIVTLLQFLQLFVIKYLFVKK